MLTLLKGQHFENLTQMCSFDEKKTEIVEECSLQAVLDVEY